MDSVLHHVSTIAPYKHSGKSEIMNLAKTPQFRSFSLTPHICNSKTTVQGRLRTATLQARRSSKEHCFSFLSNTQPTRSVHCTEVARFTEQTCIQTTAGLTIKGVASC
eukprot:scpid77063/ scgid8502/ 